MPDRKSTLHLVVDGSRMKAGAAAAERSLDGVRSKAGLVTKALGAIGTALVLRDAIRTVSGFSETMSTLKAVSGATATEFERLEAQSRKLGATTRFTARQAGEAQVFLARAGFTVRENLQALPATLDLAAAGALDLGEAADHASNIMRQFSLEATDMTHVTDVLVKTANSANTNVSQLAEALVYAGPVAAATGKSLDETAAAVGALGDAGIQASMAGTNLRGILAALLGPAGDGAKALDKMSLSLDDINPEKHDLINIFEKFNEANLSAADAVAIFGRRNAAAALILAGSTEKIKALTEANKKSTGTAAEAARVMDDNLAGSFRRLRSAIEEAYHQVGDAGMTGGLRSLIDVATQTVQILSGVESQTGEVSATAVVLANTIKVITVGMSALIAVKAAAWFTKLAKGIGTATLAMRTYTDYQMFADRIMIPRQMTAGIMSWRTLSGVLKSLAAFLISPAGIVGSLAAAGVALAIFGRRSDETAEKLKRLKEESVDIADEAERASRAWEDYQKAFLFKDYEKQLSAIKDVTEALRDQYSTIYHGKEKTVDVEQLTKSGVGIKAIRQAYFEAFKASLEDATTVADFSKALKENKAFTPSGEFQKIISSLMTPEMVSPKLWHVDKTGTGGTRSLFDVDEAGRTLKEKLLEVSQDELELRFIAKEDALRAIFTTLEDRLGEAFDKTTKKELAGALQYLEVMAKAQRERREAEKRGLSAADVDAAIKALEDEYRLKTASEDVQTKILASRKAEQVINELNTQLNMLDAETQAKKRAEIERLVLLNMEIEKSKEKQLDLDMRDARVLGQKFDRESAAKFLARREEESRRYGKAALMGDETARLYDLEQDVRYAVRASLPDLAKGTGAGKAIEDLTVDRFRALEKERILMERLGRAGDTMSSSITSGIEAMLVDGASFKDVAAGVFKDVQRALLEAFALDPLKNALKNLISGALAGLATSHRGNVFMNGRLVPFAAGGVVFNPAWFPMSDGNIGTVAEKRPEAIMPLAKTSGGELGVKMAGGGGAPSVINFTMHVHGVRDFDSFRRSSAQIRGMMQSMIERKR